MTRATGKVHAETTSEYKSIHDEYANAKLKECAIGSVTEKAKEVMKKQAEKEAKSREREMNRKSDCALNRYKWMGVKVRGEGMIEEGERVTWVGHRQEEVV